MERAPHGRLPHDHGRLHVQGGSKPGERHGCRRRQRPAADRCALGRGRHQSLQLCRPQAHCVRTLHLAVLAQRAAAGPHHRGRLARLPRRRRRFRFIREIHRRDARRRGHRRGGYLYQELDAHACAAARGAEPWRVVAPVLSGRHPGDQSLRSRDQLGRCRAGGGALHPGQRRAACHDRGRQQRHA